MYVVLKIFVLKDKTKTILFIHVALIYFQLKVKRLFLV